MSFETNSKAGSEAGEKSVPCEGKSCYFWGRPSTNNMCSQCYKEYLKDSQNGNTGEKLEVMPEKRKSVPAPVVEIEKVEEKKELEAQEDKLPPPTPVAKVEEVPKKVQKDKRRCLECNKFVGFTGIKCKCGFVYCGSHRMPENHSCDFDFDGLAKSKLRGKTNEAAIADKLDGERL